jgi:predicted DNA-binding ribbon-helix-helix protein
MNATFNLNANELDENFLESVKKLFKNKKISINIEIAEIEDETTYLLSNFKRDKKI